ncbi:MAG: hypothetical protein ACI845_003574 [Gammaproteobacteria bacterium]|jgi:hypothetical protein
MRNESILCEIDWDNLFTFFLGEKPVLYVFSHPNLESIP